MRIAYVSSDPGVPVFGHKGCSVHVQEVIHAWRARGDDVELFAARTGGEPPDDLADIVVHELPRPTDEDPRERETALLAANSATSQAIADAGPFDMIYERHALWSYAAMEHARETGVVSVLEVNAPLVEEQRRHRQLFAVGAAERAARRAFAAAGAIVAVSDSVAHYVRRLIRRDDRVHVIENGVNPARFAAAGEKNYVGEGPFTVGFVGSMKSWHGLETLVDAFALLHRDEPYSRLLLVGDGPERDVIRRRLGAQSPALNDAIHMVGAVAPTDVSQWLSQMDVAVACPPHMDEYYFSPLKVFEYMAAGLPVVASHVGQIPHVVENGIHGLLCQPGDAQEVASALRKLALAPDLRRRMGQAGRSRVMERHTWSAIIDRIAALATAAGAASAQSTVLVQEA